jgi:hypothetical protein
MTAKTYGPGGTHLATVPAAMRFYSVLLALGVLLAPALAGAQASVTITQVTRFNSPRASEVPSGVVPITDPIGIRDCRCELWRVQGNYVSPPNGQNLEFWIGATPDSCKTSTNRFSSSNPTTNPTCFQINTSAVPSQPVGTGQNSFDVVIPARFLVDPLNGQCVPPGSFSTINTVNLSVLIRPPNEDPPIANQPFSYNLVPPPAPTSATATAGENSATVTWTIGQVTDDGGIPSIPPQVSGFWVLCVPRPPSFDAGTPFVCDSAVREDATVDVPTDIATDIATDGARDVVTSDIATMDVTMDAATSFDASTMDGGGGGVCTATFPPGFDPNNDEQFQQFRCSNLLGRTATSFHVTGLTNGAGVQFAVVTQDTAGNRSVLSPLTACTTPQLVTDFWEYYESQGGQVKPGFCAVHPGFAGSSAVGVVAFGGAVAALVRRRRARKTKANDTRPSA